MPYQSGHESLGVIDIGSNSVRMVVYDLAHTPPEKIFNEKVVCALGRDLGVSGHLNPDAIDSAYKALQAYKMLSEVYHVKSLEVVGTAALRDAIDGADFLRHAHDELGLSIRIISGDEEATYAAHGVLMFDARADGVVADFGGGSLELARVRDNAVHDTISLPFGAYRVQALGDRAKEVLFSSLEPLQGRFGKLKALYAIGGSWRVLALAYMRHRSQRADLQGYRISTPDMIDFCRHIKEMDAELVSETYRMESHQSRMAAVSAYTLELVLTALAPDHFIVSTAGVRDGVAHEFLLSDTKNK